jgi:hypothetical protein
MLVSFAEKHLVNITALLIYAETNFLTAKGTKRHENFDSGVLL